MVRGIEGRERLEAPIMYEALAEQTFGGLGTKAGDGQKGARREWVSLRNERERQKPTQKGGKGNGRDGRGWSKLLEGKVSTQARGKKIRLRIGT